MGDRRMAEIKTDDGSLYVYTHWCGQEFPAMAEAAIVAAKGHWSDRSYATRIIVDQLTKSERDGETGFGLSLRPDHEDSYNGDEPSVIIDLLEGTLKVCTESVWGLSKTFSQCVTESEQ